MPKRAWIVFALATTLLGAGGAGASSSDRPAGASARAYGIRVVVPGQAGGATGTVSAPQDSVQFAGGFSCCNGLVTTGSITASATAASGSTGEATATAQVDGISLFGGEVTASAVGKAHASASVGSATGDFGGSTAVVNGTALGPGGRVSLGDWGYAVGLEEGVSRTATPVPSYHAYVTALDIHLTVDHGGLPANTEVLVGYAEVSVESPPAPPVTTTPPKVVRRPRKAPKSQPSAPEPTVPTPFRAPPADVHPKLTAGRYVFPVYGPSSFTDTFGAFRGDVAGNWHHGDDIFAPLGAPVLACADGTVFSVGWNSVGGNRLWLRDRQGNEFYYAHLSAYTPLAVNGAQVQAGDVLGFVGNTGDAQGTPYHLHFEVHPLGRLSLGYDGAINPTPYLQAWEHLQDVRFDAAAGWAPSAAHSIAPEPGAVLLQVSDISSASGLDPASLRRAMAPVSAAKDSGGLTGATARAPARDLTGRRGP